VRLLVSFATSSPARNWLHHRPATAFFLLSLLAAPLTATTGCNRSGIVHGTTSVAAQQRSDRLAQTELVREQLDLIPPPSKSRYLAIHSLTSWENPYLTVQGNMLTLHVTVADANTSDLGVGSILRPVGARRQDLNIRTSDLPIALNAVPQTAWPYGRVVALEEAHDTPVSDRPQVRRNMETAMQMLSDLGIVVYDWTDSGNPAR
jgi:hypothetical protein